MGVSREHATRRISRGSRVKVLIVEDDEKIASLLKKGLTEAGYNPEVVHDGEAALVFASAEDFDLLIADVMLPGLDGLSMIEELRRRGRDMPVLVLSAKRSIEDRVEGLRRGGDDYMTKPFSISELLARCQALLRRTSKQAEVRRLKFLDLEMDLNTRVVKRAGSPIELQQREFALLEYFLRSPNHVITKTQILEKIWNYDFDPQTNVVDVLVCRLRNKVDRDFSAKVIQTIRGVGYVLRSE